MFHLIRKNYLYHGKNHIFFIISYSLIFILFLVMVSDITDLENTNSSIVQWPINAHYYSGTIQNAFSDVHSISPSDFNNFLKKLSQSQGVNKIGFEKMNSNFKIEQHNSLNLTCVYISPYMKQIRYALSAGKWFDSKSKSQDVVIGGTLNRLYNVGDTLSIEKENGSVLNLHVIGELKSPSKVMLLNSGGSPMTFETALNDTLDNIIITTNLDVIDDNSTNYCMCSVVLDINPEFVSSFRNHLSLNENITSFSDIYRNSKKDSKHNLIHSNVFMLLLFGELLLIMFNETYLHIKNSYGEISVYNMLGMNYSAISIYVLIPQICNLITASFIATLYALIASHNSNIEIAFNYCYPLIMLLIIFIISIISLSLVALLIRPQEILANMEEFQ